MTEISRQNLTFWLATEPTVLGVGPTTEEGHLAACFLAGDMTDDLALFVQELQGPSPTIQLSRNITWELALRIEATYVPWDFEDKIVTLLRSKSCDQSDSASVCVQGVRLNLTDAPPPPRRVPEKLFPQFSMWGQCRIHYPDSFRYEPSGRARTPVPYTEGYIDELVQQVQQRQHQYYGDTDKFLYGALHMANGLSDQEVAIIGSVEPWYEAVCIAYGARHCTTIDHNPVNYGHRTLSSMTLQQYQSVEFSKRKQFDTAFSISTFEHDGLGRYGDPLDPDADLRSMEWMRELVLPGGRLFLAVPVGPDRIRWNMHRLYGPARLPLLLRGWSVIAVIGFHSALFRVEDPQMHVQPIFVLENTGTEELWDPFDF